MDEHAAFLNSGGDAATPLLLTAPHCGRHYPESLLRMSRLPVEFLRKLEDPFIDLLAAQAVAAGQELIAATFARAWIDLNRGERDIDPGMIDSANPAIVEPTARAKSGLGLFPRLIGNQPLLRRKMRPLEASERINTTHKPYHALIMQRLEYRRRRHSIALLVDCHSMPSLPAAPYDPKPPAIVLGDLHGQAAASWITSCAERHFAGAGLTVRRNRPYAGGYTLERHAAPHHGIHALQIEIDRALYMDVRTHQPHEGVARIGKVLAGLTEALSAELSLRSGNDQAVAAE